MNIFEFSVHDYESSRDFQWTHADPNNTEKIFRNDLFSTMKQTGEQHLKECSQKEVMLQCYGEDKDWIDKIADGMEKIGYVPLKITASIGIFDPTYSVFTTHGEKIDLKNSSVKMLCDIVGVDLIKKMHKYSQKAKKQMMRKEEPII